MPNAGRRIAGVELDSLPILSLCTRPVPLLLCDPGESGVRFGELVVEHECLFGPPPGLQADVPWVSRRSPPHMHVQYGQAAIGGSEARIFLNRFLKVFFRSRPTCPCCYCFVGVSATQQV